MSALSSNPQLYHLMYWIRIYTTSELSHETLWADPNIHIIKNIAVLNEQGKEG